MKKLLINILKFVLFFGTGFTILYFVYQKQETAFQAQCVLDGVPLEDCSLVNKVWSDFQGVHYGWLLLVLVSFMFSNVSRTIRWHMLIRPLGYQPRFINGFFTIMLGYFANLGFPRLGEVLRPATFSRYEKVPFEKIMGTVVIDRMADVLSLLVVIGLAFLFEFNRILDLIRTLNADGENPEGGGLPIWFWVLLIGGVVGLIVVIAYWNRLKQIPIFNRLLTIVEGFAEGLKTVLQLDRPVLFILHSLNIWFMYYLMNYFGFLSFGPTEQLGLMAALMVFAVGTLGIVIPAPGGMGTYHFLVVAVLTAFYGIANGDAFSFAMILFFAVQVGCNVLFGLLSLIVLPIVNRNYIPKHAEGQEPE
ncbi:MAG: lysylphosphatidylglycerol synthase transmembrane domain-containing protein [Bacteroidota bacterium]